MKINGVGIISKKKLMKEYLTLEGRRAVRSGDLTNEELAEMYKDDLVRKASKNGSYDATFNYNYALIPAEVKDQLTPEQLGKLVDLLCAQYDKGKNAGWKEHEEFIS